MAKEKFERSKPHVNIGTIGHVDHGKDHFDCCYHYCVGKKGLSEVRSFDLDRQRSRGKRAWYYYQYFSRRISNCKPSLCSR